MKVIFKTICLVTIGFAVSFVVDVAVIFKP
jgi:hypothetical protein